MYGTDTGGLGIGAGSDGLLFGVFVLFSEMVSKDKKEDRGGSILYSIKDERERGVYYTIVG